MDFSAAQAPAKKRPARLAWLFALVVVGTVELAYCAFRETPSVLAAEGVYDGFESPTLGDLWTTEKFEPGAVVMQSAVVRAGKSAARITVHQGDRYEGTDASGSLVSERAELLERADLYAHEGGGCEYAFSIFIPPDFPVVPTRLVLAQWKQDNEKHATLDNPLVALRYVGGELYVTTQTDEKKVVRFRTKEDIRGHWQDFVFRIRFSRNGDGFVRVSRNGREILDFEGATAYGEASGYPQSGVFYFKMGLYRDRMAEPMTAYFDEYRKRPLRADETPAGI